MSIPNETSATFIVAVTKLGLDTSDRIEHCKIHCAPAEHYTGADTDVWFDIGGRVVHLHPADVDGIVSVMAKLPRPSGDIDSEWHLMDAEDAIYNLLHTVARARQQHKFGERPRDCGKPSPDQDHYLCVLPTGHLHECLFVGPPVRISGTMVPV